jgi:hypothetical protein
MPLRAGIGMPAYGKFGSTDAIWFKKFLDGKFELPYKTIHLP